MRRALRTSALAAALLVPAGFGLPAVAQVNVEFQWGTPRRPLVGRRYESMRSLAHELDGRARQTAEQAIASVRRPSRAERKLADALNDFARRAGSFHERVDAYGSHPRDLPSEVNGLVALSQRVNDRIRDARISVETRDDWRETLDVLDRMQRVLAGQDVPIAPPHRWGTDRDYDEHQRSYERSQRLPEAGVVPNAVPGDVRETVELRGLANRLVEVTATARAEAGQWEDPFRDRHARSLDHLVDQARQIQQMANDRVDPRTIGPVVDHLQNDIRLAERHLRETPSLQSALPSWNEMHRVLDRIDQLTR